MIKFDFIESRASFHGLDPRTTFTVALVICFFAIILNGLIIITVFAILVIIVATGKLIRRWLHTLRNISILAAFIFAVKFFSIIYSPNYIAADAIFTSTILMIKFIVIVQAFSFFYLSTTTDDFGLALQQSKFPYSACFTLILSMMFLPTLFEEAQSISDAQRSRGLELDKGVLLKRLKKINSTLIPLLINSIRKSLEVAEAMECRCYGINKKRTSIYTLTLKKRDFAIIIISFALATIYVGIRLG